MQMQKISIGDLVLHKGTKTLGKVTKIQKNKATIQVYDAETNQAIKPKKQVTELLHTLTIIKEDVVLQQEPVENIDSETQNKLIDYAQQIINKLVLMSEISGNTLNSFAKNMLAARNKEISVPFHNNPLDARIAMVDALTDALYFSVGTQVEIGGVPNPSIEKMVNQVAEFHTVGKHPVNTDAEKTLTTERYRDRIGYTVEEIVEFIHAISQNKDDFNDIYTEIALKMVDYQQLSATTVKKQTAEEKFNTIKQLNNQIITTIKKAFYTIGVKDSEVFFDIVHNANMTKFFIDENGNYYAKTRKSDGKILKSPDFEPPEGKIKEAVKELFSELE